MDRDPARLGRSIGVFVEPTAASAAQATGPGVPITGSSSEVAETLARFRTIGATRVELMLWPGTLDSLDALVPAMELITE